jgi:hypothetical protein
MRPLKYASCPCCRGVDPKSCAEGKKIHSRMTREMPAQRARYVACRRSSKRTKPDRSVSRAAAIRSAWPIWCRWSCAQVRDDDRMCLLLRRNSQIRRRCEKQACRGGYTGLLHIPPGRYASSELTESPAALASVSTLFRITLILRFVDLQKP